MLVFLSFISILHHFLKKSTFFEHLSAFYYHFSSCPEKCYFCAVYYHCIIIFCHSVNCFSFSTIFNITWKNIILSLHYLFDHFLKKYVFTELLCFIISCKIIMLLTLHYHFDHFIFISWKIVIFSCLSVFLVIFKISWVFILFWNLCTIF